MNKLICFPNSSLCFVSFWCLLALTFGVLIKFPVGKEARPKMGQLRNQNYPTAAAPAEATSTTTAATPIKVNESSN